ncbi:hypothetical protein GCM10009087_10120 [Sphingomonas oligophenolica]|uniref:DUF3617 domain-containing protein n=1 Tax=Sphingomonas oligophenolica TaxID=301154 RepID=A0ABU9Y8U0_9SPHN
MNRLLAAAPLLLVLPAATSSLPIQPGKWQSIVTITDMQSPRMPRGVGAAMRAHPTTVTACVTAVQAANGPRAVLQGSNGKCRYTSFNATGGRLSSVMVCAFASGTMTVTSNGGYTATTMDVSGSSVSTGRMQMTSKTHTSARRLGGC